MQQWNFSEQVVWVTGAAGGIGQHIALSFANAGAQVLGFDIEFNNVNYPFDTHVLDVSSAKEVDCLCSELLSQNEKINVLVNAAGILRVGSTETISDEDFQACFSVNVGGAMNIFRNVLPQFKRQRHGAIVTIASNSGHVPRLGMSAYGASKAALISLCKTVGLEMAEYGVRSNIISPGSTDTAMLRSMCKDESGLQQTIQGLPDQYKLAIPLGKLAQRTDIAALALFLASSDLAGHITMQDIVLDGGATLGA